MDKKEKLFEVLNNHFNLYNEFPEFSQIDEEDIEKIIALYEQEASKGGRDPWHYLYFDELIIMQMCVYEVIKNIPKYSEVTDKIEALYQKELDRRLQRPVLDYGEETGEMYRTSYAEMPEYSLVLADMCSRHMQEAMDVEHMPLAKIEAALSTYESIKSDFVKAGKEMPEEQEHLALQTKTMVTLANKERNDIVERERQQREIELINLQQEINKMENERLEIEKRLKTISSETLGSYFSRQISEKYPEEYQKFQQNKEQVRNYSSNAPQISDLKERFNRVAEDLKFYKGMLPVYESYYQRFEEMKKKYHQQRTTSSQEQQPISNSEPFVRETPTQNQQQIVSENKTSGLSQPNFNGLSDDVKRKIIEQMQLRGQGDVIISGIDNIYQEGNYIVVDAKQSNGCFAGAEFTIDDFNKIINSPIQQVDEQQTKNNQESNIPQNNFDKDLIMFIEAKNSNLGKVSEILSVTGYPDSTYEVRFENGTTHQITITQDEKKFIKNHPPVQQPVQEKQSAKIIPPVQPVVEHFQQQVSQEESEKILQDQQKQMKDQVINQIMGVMGAMNKSGELSFGDISMGERMSIMQNIQNKLNAKSMDELQMLLSTYQEQNIQEESMHSRMHR